MSEARFLNKARDFSRHYQAFAKVGGTLKHYQANQNGIKELKLECKECKVDIKTCSILQGVSVDFGEFVGDFGHLDLSYDKPSVNFGLIQSGYYKSSCDGQDFALSDDEMFVISPNMHDFGQNAKAQCKCVQINIDIQEASKDINAFFSEFDLERFYEMSNQNPYILDACVRDKMLFHHIEQTKCVDMIRLKVLECLLEIDMKLKQARATTPTTCQSTQYTTKAYIARVKEYLQANYFLSQDELNLRDLSERFSVCVSKLTQDFAKYEGISIYQFLKSCKINNACKILKEGKSISFTANEVGYINVSCFCKNFKEKYGISPREFQKIAK